METFQVFDEKPGKFVILSSAELRNRGSGSILLLPVGLNSNLARRPSKCAQREISRKFSRSLTQVLHLGADVKMQPAPPLRRSHAAAAGGIPTAIADFDCERACALAGRPICTLPASGALTIDVDSNASHAGA